MSTSDRPDADPNEPRIEDMSASDAVDRLLADQTPEERTTAALRELARRVDAIAAPPPPPARRAPRRIR